VRFILGYGMWLTALFIRPESNANESDAKMNDELKGTLRKAAHIQTVVIAGKVMTEMASKMSTRFDSFGTWLLAGFGAGMALLLARHDQVSVIPVTTIKLGATLFLVSVVLVVLEKYLAIVVGAAADVSEFTMQEINEHFKKQQEDKISPSIDLTVFNEKLLLGILPTHRWLVAWSIKRASNGDHSSSGQKLLWMAQFQGILIFVEAVIFLWAIGQLICTLPLDKA